MLDLTPWLLTWALAALPVLARVAALAWTAPALGLPALGWRVRLGLALTLTMLVAPLIATGGATPATANDPGSLAWLALAEAATGVLLGLGMGLVLAAARLAGEIVGVQAGLSVAGLLDPTGSGGSDADLGAPGLSPMGRLYGLVALATFLALDGPLMLVAVLIESYQAVPVGGLPLDPSTVDAAFARVGWALSLTLRAAAPAGLALALAGLALGLLARAANGLQVLTLSLPIRAALGLALVLVGLLAAVSTFQAAWLDTFTLPP